MIGDLLDQVAAAHLEHRDRARSETGDTTVCAAHAEERNRLTRQIAWPGEPPADTVEEVAISDRDEDFVHVDVEMPRPCSTLAHILTDSPNGCESEAAHTYRPQIP